MLASLDHPHAKNKIRQRTRCRREQTRQWKDGLGIRACQMRAVMDELVSFTMRGRVATHAGLHHLCVPRCIDPMFILAAELQDSHKCPDAADSRRGYIALHEVHL